MRRLGLIAQLSRMLGRALGQSAFPPKLSWVLELPWRRLVLSPETLVSRLAVAPNAVVLEIGPGSGYYSIPVARCLPDGHLELLDVQHEMVVRCAKKCRALGVENVALVVANAALVPYRDSRLDLVFMVTVLGEVEDLDACLNSLKGVLKPGGVLSISEHWPDPDFIAFSTLRKEVERAGFRFLRRYGSFASYTANFSKPVS